MCLPSMKGLIFVSPAGEELPSGIGRRWSRPGGSKAVQMKLWKRLAIHGQLASHGRLLNSRLLNFCYYLYTKRLLYHLDSF